MGIVGATVLSDAYERKIAVGVCIVFAAFATVAAIFGQARGPELTLPLTIAAIVWSLCDLLTAFFLLLLAYARSRPALAIVAAAFIVSGLLTWPYLLTYLADLRAGAQSADLQIPAALYITWHITFAVLVLAAHVYERVTERQAPPPRSWRPAMIGGGGAVLAVLLYTVVVLNWRVYLPTFVVDGIFQPAYWAVGIPLVLAITGAACIVLVLAQRARTSRFSTWLSVALFTSLLDGLLNLSTPIRFSYAWDAGKLLTVATATIVMCFLLIENVRLHLRTSQELDARTSRGASRLRALWQIATSEATSESAHLQMVLDVATAHIRSQHDVLGVLSHLDDGRIVVDAQARQGTSSALDAAAAAYAPERSFPFDGDVHASMDARGGTTFWSDGPDAAPAVSVAPGVRSIIGSPIYIGNETHFISFCLADRLSDEPFIESDIAFVDVIASNIGHRFHQRSQLERLQYQIEHDSLTALYNRTQFLRFGRTKVADGSLFGIITINLDAFRRINERHGQMIGDEVLLEIASRLRHVDERDIVARLGGDDFAVLLGPAESGESLAGRVTGYERAFRQPFHTGDRDGKVFLDVSASLGAAAFVRGAHSFDITLSNANIALDAAKSSGGAIGTAFGPQLEAIALERALENTEVRAALHNDEFVLEYQPTIEMVTRRVVGAEALIRWQHPSRGRLPPAAFLGLVNRANLLAEMTVWVMRRIALDLQTAALPDDVRIYVNVPAQVLETDAFLSQLEALLDERPELAQRLGLEITESDVMNRVERAITTLQIVRRLGLRVSIDDFGTGYSSLSYLKRLPIDIVKLDKSFIDGLPDDENDIALAKMFLALCSQFGLISVAEGVENERQAAWLVEHGCMIVQGFLFSVPLPLDAFIAFVERTNSALR